MLLRTVFLHVSIMICICSCHEKIRLAMVSQDLTRINAYPTLSPLFSQKTRNIIECIAMCLEYNQCSVIFINDASFLCKLYNTSRMSISVLDMNLEIDWHFYHRNHKLCPLTSGYVYSQVLDRCTKAFGSGTTYGEGKYQCERTDASLVKVDSQAMWQFVKTVLMSTGVQLAYIQGAKDVKGDWRYDDGTLLSYINWAPKEPDNTSIDIHLTMWSGDDYRFHAVTGNNLYGYVCEIDLMS